MIIIKQRGEKWRLKIENEEWEFDNLKCMKDYLGVILKIKETYGDVR